ncbi:hypothetical protein [Scytonema sp. PCC 10023]|uniref:hypothetical protein n=1 Tax=Scytonema sp. PCC 10023 TaxID=1680591 RepID=UPI0039C70BF7
MVTRRNHHIANRRKDFDLKCRIKLCDQAQIIFAQDREVPTTKTEYCLWWGFPVSFVDATLGIP